MCLFGAQLCAQQVSDNEVKQHAKQKYPNLFLPRDEFETTAEYNQRLRRQVEIIGEKRKELLSELKEKKAELSEVHFEIINIGSYNADHEYFNDFEIMETIPMSGFGYIHYITVFERPDKVLYTKRKVQIYDSTNASKHGSLGSVPKNTTIPFMFKLAHYYAVSLAELGHLIKPLNSQILKDKASFNYKLIMPRSEARTFKQNLISVNVKGFKQLKDDSKTYEYINMVAIHPITGSRFPFGPTKDLAIAPVIASKKTIVPPNLTMKVAFVESNGNGFLDAEEKGKVKVSITNSGKGSAMGVFVKLNAETSNKAISIDPSKMIGEVSPGQTKTTEFSINANKSVTKMVNKFTVSATESYGFPPDPIQILFETFPLIPPKLTLVDYGISTATGDNIIRPGVVVTVQARVQNTGQGEAEGSAFSINLPTGVYFSPDSRQNYTFSSLKPGEFKDLEFSFTPSKKVGRTINLAIGFTERSSSGKFPLKLDVKKPQKSIQQLVVKGQELGKVAIANVATVSVDIEKGIPKSSRKGKKDLAVVFGIERYKNVPGVSFAKRDALWTKKYFENVLGIPSNRIYYKTDSDVGQAEFSKVFSKDGWIDKRIKNNETNVFIYYAGHGAPDLKKNKAYLIPYDGDPNYASQTGYEMDKLYAELGNMQAKSVTVFLDACFSGANRDNEMLLAGARPVFIEVKSGIPGNVTVFSAAGGKEISSAWPEKKHGLFSYYLMKGMRGDADANRDKKITVGELGDYIRENVSDMAGMLDREQTPGLQTMYPDKVLIQY